MPNKVSIIEYHYVRDLKNSRYPRINGLSAELFKEQLFYILKHYKVIRMEDLIAAVQFEKLLPDNALILTFDDGLRDHFEFVFPILSESGLQGSFFPPARIFQEPVVLAVHKIHFILAAVENKEQLIRDIFGKLDQYREEYSLASNEDYYRQLAQANRFNPKDVIFIKRILQKGLPEKLRNIIIDDLFKKYVSPDEQSFSKELYLDLDQVKVMKERGMFIGSHGFDHYWLDTLSPAEQEKEIDLSLEFLKKIGCDLAKWVISYPYAAHNDSLISIIKEKGCILGLIEDARIADLDKDNHFILPRLDTNDFPKDRNAATF